MRRFVSLLLAVILVVCLVGCGDSSGEVSSSSSEVESVKMVTSNSTEEVSSTEEDSNKIKVTTDSVDYLGMNYQDVVAELEAYGFTNIEVTPKEYKYNASGKKNGEVTYISVGDALFDIYFDAGDEVEADTPISITYCVVEKEEQVDDTVLTVDNCAELKAMLENPADIDESYTAFGIAYAGRTFEFDGCVRSVQNHEGYDTRYDILISGGDFDPDHQYGPSFKFTNVSGSDLGVGLWLDDVVYEEANVHVKAIVKNFSQTTGIFTIEPVEVTSR